MYGAEADQLAMIRSVANRLRQKGSVKAPPTVSEGALLNKQLVEEHPDATSQEQLSIHLMPERVSSVLRH